MAPATEEPREVPSAVLHFARKLLLAKEAVALYPPSSPIPLDLSRSAIELLNDADDENKGIVLAVSKDGVFFENTQLFPRLQAFTALGQQLYQHRVAEVRFHPNAIPEDVVQFFGVLNTPRETVAAEGGFRAVLDDKGVTTVTAAEAHVSLVEAEIMPGVLPHEDHASLVSGRVDIDSLLSDMLGPGPLRERTLARLVGNPDVIRDYLEATCGGQTGLGGSGFEVTTDRFMDILGCASQDDPHADGLIASLSEALRILEPHLRRELLLDLLPKVGESASLGAVLERIDIDEVCRMLVDGPEPHAISAERLARAVHGLVLLRSIDRDKVIAAAGAAMLGAGLGEQVATEVLERGAPRSLKVGDGAEPTGPVTGLESLIEMASLGSAVDSDSVPASELTALRTEAADGITDGDVIWALVTLVTHDTREAPFASIMSLLEDSLGLLLARGEIQIAADAAYAMLDAAKNPSLTVGQRTRLENAVGRFARSEDVHEIARSMRTHAPGTPEYVAASQLLRTLGVVVIEPLLEQLAQEENMAVRKSLVDVLSGIAVGHIPQIGTFTADHRWYFVRNVVTILGSTRSPESLAYLERTMRHMDSRVRRETIRALSGVDDPRFEELLISGLGDRDAQNVQLAASTLGLAGVRSSVPTLLLVANGKGGGNRDIATRVKAIEALGKVAGAEAVPALTSLAERRAILGAGRSRELRTAADAALIALRARGVRTQ